MLFRVRTHVYFGKTFNSVLWFLKLQPYCFYEVSKTHTHTHRQTYIYIFIYLLKTKYRTYLYKLYFSTSYNKNKTSIWNPTECNIAYFLEIQTFPNWICPNLTPGIRSVFKFLTGPRQRKVWEILIRNSTNYDVLRGWTRVLLPPSSPINNTKRVRQFEPFFLKKKCMK